MKTIIKKILISLILIATILEITYISLANSITSKEIKQSIKENFLTGLIYDDSGSKTEIFNTILKLTTLDENTVIKLMENKKADEIITDVVNSIYDYNLTGDESYKYSEQRIINIVEENMDQILTEIDYPITQKERQEVLKYTYNNTKYIINTIYSTDIGDYKKW